MVDARFARLDAAREQSVLPEPPANTLDIERWLVEVRRSRFAPRV